MPVARSLPNFPQTGVAGSSSAGAANPKIPMFLQKLYKIVDDPDTNDVVCWSDNGESFLVLDQDRLAKNHLGNWFKHSKFASFVRQLNMYGFHKVPHLHSGVLNSGSYIGGGDESWEFAHEHFRRGDMGGLALIERKKPVGGQNQQNQQQQPQQQQPQQQQLVYPVPDVQAGAVGQQAPAGPLDLPTVISTLTSIRRNQTTIASELEELKRTNQMLWQESMEARTRHQKQQDMINRIVKFLAGIFGQHHHPAGGGVTAAVEKDGHVSNGVPVSGGRLMIEGPPGSEAGTAKGIFNREASPSASRIVQMDTPTLTDLPTFSSGTVEDVPSPAPTQSAAPVTTPPSRALTRSPSVDPSARVADALSSMPAPTIQQLLQMFGSNNGSSLPSLPLQTDTPLPPMDPNLLWSTDFSSLISPSPPMLNSPMLSSPPTSSNNAINPLDLSTLPAANSSSTLTPSINGSNTNDNTISAPPSLPANLNRTWSSLSDITDKVNDVGSNIQSIIDELGFDQMDRYGDWNNSGYEGYDDLGMLVDGMNDATPNSTPAVTGANQGANSNSFQPPPIVASTSAASNNILSPGTGTTDDMRSFLSTFSVGSTDTQSNMDHSAMMDLINGGGGSVNVNMQPTTTEPEADPAPQPPTAPETTASSVKGRKRKSDAFLTDNVVPKTEEVEESSLGSEGKRSATTTTTNGRAKRRRG